ncbi:tryptophan transporter [Bacillus badius]|uniref:Substrate-specific component TrpP of tryptophan ECF transporter n=1 Tax=Bacillus badius TaxID=1455 RepID=A0ABR5AS61_BACBA|nr:tryptophan transporter [Bacillus badius]KIL73047.1 Substrate-specific component TrpP of tryptophan ECF transporter [Bacillus badius]KIL77591.1 Substrate-specific component TrpP of tryptophan ECF transporter [Bacillus badius]KZR59049.1 tryptophan transporter [Bacillus badius]MED4716861.1 tryptophan transporter [Bacillus badius]
MNTKSLVTLSLLIGMGAVLHTVMPGLFLGMKPDMMLTMMFLGILLFPNLKSVLLAGLVTGVISGLTTSFPGGMIPNMLDKPVTAVVFYGLFLLFARYGKNTVGAAALTAVGTIVSGVVFLGSALVTVGLPGPFAALFLTIVLPASAVNAVVMAIIYPIVQSVLKRSNLAEPA